MALTVPQMNHVSNAAQVAKKLLDMYGDLVRLDVQWAGTANYDSLIDQVGIDGIPNFRDAGLTNTGGGTPTGTLVDAEFALASIKTTITNALPALDALARAGG